jgi:hypothetical protein
MTVLAYPGGTADPGAGRLVMHKQHTQLVLCWPG